MEKKLRLNTKGVIRFLIWYLLLFAIWWFFRSYMLFLAMVLIPCCGGLSIVLLWMSRDKIWAEIVMPGERVGKAAEFGFDIRIQHGGFISGFTTDLTYTLRNVFTGHEESKKLHLWLMPPHGFTKKQWLQSRYAGRVEAEITEFVVYDLFHMITLCDCAASPATVLVWPAFVEEGEEELYSCVEGFPKENESRRRGAEYNPDYEIREYIPGDELKSIHWKLTAKQDRLMVRERLATGREKINVLLPLGADKEENDGLMEALYGLCRLLLHKEYPIQLYWPGKGALQGCFIAELGELENAISRILSTNTLDREDAREWMEIEHPGEKYILVQTGAYKGAYIQ